MSAKEALRCASAAAMSILAASGWAGPLAMTEESGMRWVCGGVGAEERRELAALEPRANLKLLFVTQRRGGYLADVAVAVVGQGAAAPRLEFRSDGPMCLLSAPPGAYRIEARFGGTSRSVAVTLGAPGAKLQRAVFAFPGEPWDGIWADEEEKRGARPQPLPNGFVVDASGAEGAWRSVQEAFDKARTHFETKS